MKCKLYIITFVLISCTHKVFSQNDSLSVRKNSLFLEVGGVGGYGSLNYERTFISKKSWSIGMRLGISTYHLYDYTNNFNPDILIPFSVNAYYGKRHKIELGFGQILTNIVYADSENFKPSRETQFHTNFIIGYKYQKKLNGVFFRCSYTPIVELNNFFRHWAGASIGFSF